MQNGREKWYLLFYPIVLIATFLVSYHPFFWDTVQLASKHGHFFYDNDFQSLILPEELDSGHPPLFGIYIASAWKLFGKSLLVSHFAMLPFLFGIVFFLQKIGQKITDAKNSNWLVLLCLVDPVLASQSILISPDIVLVCCFLMGIWAIWEAKFYTLVLAVIGLGLISTRGMMVAAALFLFSISIEGQRISLSFFLRKLWPFLPGGILAAAYLFYHWQQTGWIGYHAGSTWAPSFERVDFQGLIKNLIVLAWRFADFGRVFIWVFLGLVIFTKFRNLKGSLKKINSTSIRVQLFLLLILVFIFTVPTQLFYKGLLAHRYVLPCFLSLNFIVFYFFTKNPAQSHVLIKWAKPVLIVCLITGNLWVYPQKIAMGWDSTLAHVPWYGLLRNTMDFLKESNIPFGEVGTAFPNVGERELYELDGTETGFSKKNLTENCYIFYSNIMNDFSDEERKELQGHWPIIFEQKSGGVYTVIYKNPNPKVCGN